MADYYLSSTRFNFQGKKVFLRIDADVDYRKEKNQLVVDEDFRLKAVLPTIRFLKEKKVGQIILAGHLGRPGGKKKPELSLGPVARWFDCPLISLNQKPESDLVLLENLRFDPGEEKNNLVLAKKLASWVDVYINDSFANSHRHHASIIGLAKLLPSFLGLRVEAEIKTLSWLRKEAKRPLVFILGGSKTGKIDYLSFFCQWADYLLIGGKLPLLIKRKITNPKVKIAQLGKEEKDLSLKSIREFKEIIKKGKTIIWAGPMGVYEEKKFRQGTWETVKAIVKSNAFKVAGGGDSHRVLSWTKSWTKFDFVSAGGGAMLQFLKDETLPGIEAIIK